MRQHTLLAALSALTVAAAQNFTIDPSKVEPVQKSEWCGAQYNSCKELCDNRLTKNECDPTSLAYSCICSNGTAPGLQYYIHTIPTFVCDQAYADCIAANINSAKAQDGCKTNIKEKCGTLDPAESNAGSGSASSSAAPSGTNAPSQTSASGQNAASTSTSTAAAAATNMAYIGNGVAVVAAGVFAALL